MGFFEQRRQRAAARDAEQRETALPGREAVSEWSFSKILGVQHDPTRPWTAISVSNRQKVSGFLYDHEHTADIRFRLALALAIFNDDRPSLVADLQRQLAEHDPEHPPEPAAVPGPGDA
jgi:ABC-type transport system substrate-binding protein